MSTYMQGALKSGDGFTAAQLAAMDDIGANTTVYATVTSVGQPTAGSARVTLLYTGGVA